MKTEEKAKKPAGGVALATQGTQAISTNVDYGEDAGRGYEGQSQADMTIPFIAVLQANSPQITDREDCKPYMLYNTVTEEVFDGLKDGILIVPALTQHTFVEWKPRDAGGGFVAQHSPESDVVKKAKAEGEFGDYKTPAKNDLVETFYIFAVIAEGAVDKLAVGQFAVIAFTSTKIKVYKRWNTKIKMFTLQLPDGRKQQPPLFAHLTRLKTFKDKNNQGDFANFVLEPARGELKESLIEPGSPLLEAAKEFKKLAEQSLVRLAHDSVKGTDAASDGPKKDKEVF